MRSSSFVFIFILGHIFRNCVKIELYCVLVVGPKKQIRASQCSSLGRKFVQNVSKVPEYYLIVVG